MQSSWRDFDLEYGSDLLQVTFDLKFKTIVAIKLYSDLFGLFMTLSCREFSIHEDQLKDIKMKIQEKLSEENMYCEVIGE